MILVYVTTKNFDEARTIAEKIVEQRLAAGANIIPSMTSIYHWKGKIESSNECACIFKTTQKNFTALSSAIKALHSYETPCIIALPITEAEKAFGAWIQEECR